MNTNLHILLKGIPLMPDSNQPDHRVVGKICADSRQVGPGDVFVAVKGTLTDGHLYIEKAAAQGAAAIICENLPPVTTTLQGNPLLIRVADSAHALGCMASAYYGYPSARLKLVGITGTNGKTTTATLLYRLFTDLGYKAGLLSTIRNIIGNQVQPASHTTPDAITLNQLLAQMVAEGCSHAFMEVSSHALVQHRTAGVHFAGAVFTNITHDHLDYHKTFDEYIKAKKMLFDGLSPDAFALVNTDDKRGAVMLQNCKGVHHSFALRSAASFKGKIISNNLHGLELEINRHRAWFRLLGEFNAYNLLGIFGAAVLLGESEEQVLTCMSALESADGRFDRIVSPQGALAIVDYAHTPDALRNVLQTIARLKDEHSGVITLVGCGGNRDATKRPLMAQIACEWSTEVILTSDNPRFEEPEAIIDDMLNGLEESVMHKVKVQADRRKAIEQACKNARKGDVILIAGKGHEDYQEIKGVKYPFDDKQIVKEIFDRQPQDSVLYSNPEN